MGRVGVGALGPQLPAPGSGLLAAGWAVRVPGSGLSTAAVFPNSPGGRERAAGLWGGRGGAGERVHGAVVAVGAGEWGWAGPRSLRSPLFCFLKSSPYLPDVVFCVRPGWGWEPGHRTQSWDPVPDFFVLWVCIRAP